MSYLIDTCCISELVKRKPNPRVVKWFEDVDELTMYVSVITFGELRKGIEKLPDSEMKEVLHRWVKEDLSNRFKNRILYVTLKEVNEWGKVLAKAEKNGTPVPAIDALIAATAKVHDLRVVTRNTKDMKNCDVTLVNPWTYEPDA
ncbi:MAG: type II toxin-antitoxin system VapC family toxin [Balneolaceae bacterium]